MKEISKNLLKIIFIVVLVMSLFACKTASLVTFESEEHEKFMTNMNINEIEESFFFNRILTSICVDVVFFKYCKTNNFNDITVENFSIFDDSENIIYYKEKVFLSSNKIMHFFNDFNYQLYSYEIKDEDLSHIEFENYKTKYVILKYEIDGKEYSDKLIRKEEKYLVLPT